MRTIVIGVLSIIGGLCASQGVVHGWWQLIVFGILLVSIAFGIIVSGDPIATQTLRAHSYAIWRAAMIARIFRLFR